MRAFNAPRGDGDARCGDDGDATTTRDDDGGTERDDRVDDDAREAMGTRARVRERRARDARSSRGRRRGARRWICGR